MMRLFISGLVFCSVQAALSQKIILTNDDGWAVAQIRAQHDALIAAGFDVSTAIFQHPYTYA